MNAAMLVKPAVQLRRNDPMDPWERGGLRDGFSSIGWFFPGLSHLSMVLLGSISGLSAHEMLTRLSVARRLNTTFNYSRTCLPGLPQLQIDVEAKWI